MLSAKQKPSGGWIKPRAASLHHLIEGIHFLISECCQAYWVGELETGDSCLRLSSAYFWSHDIVHVCSILWAFISSLVKQRFLLHIPAVKETGREHQVLTALGQYLHENFYKHVMDSETPVVTFLHLSVSRGTDTFTEEVTQCQNVSLFNLQNALAALPHFINEHSLLLFWTSLRR